MMDNRYLNRLLSDSTIVSEKIEQYVEDASLKRLPVDKEEMKGPPYEGRS